MNDITSIMMIGRLTRDCELKYSEGGLAICKFSLACGKKIKDENYTSFFDVVVFGKLGEALNKYLLKGKQVAVQGEVKQERWTKDGQNHSKVTVIANNIELLGGGEKHEASTESTGAPIVVNDWGQQGEDKGKPFNDDIPF